MSIIQKFLTNHIAANEIVIIKTPYCPTPQHLLHMQKGVNLLSLKTFGESKCPAYLVFLWNYSHTHYSDVRWCTSKWKLCHRQKKKRRGEVYKTSSPISLSNTFYTKSDKKITFFRQYLSYVLWQMNWMRNTSRQIVVAMQLHWY